MKLAFYFLGLAAFILYWNVHTDVRDYAKTFSAYAWRVCVLLSVVLMFGHAFFD